VVGASAGTYGGYAATAGAQAGAALGIVAGPIGATVGGAVIGALLGGASVPSAALITVMPSVLISTLATISEHSPQLFACDKGANALAWVVVE
jgi:uncharacterized membrane protein YeaQ/YmgE (transglycosylase-associated protein family)